MSRDFSLIDNLFNHQRITMIQWSEACYALRLGFTPSQALAFVNSKNKGKYWTYVFGDKRGLEEILDVKTFAEKVIESEEHDISDLPDWVMLGAPVQSADDLMDPIAENLNWEV